MMKNIIYLLICLFSFTVSEVMAQSSQKKTVLDFTPKVPQKVINLALERVRQKEVGCIDNGTIQKKKYKIINYTTSVAVKKLWIQYKETKEGQYVCTKDTFYTSKN